METFIDIIILWGFECVACMQASINPKSCYFKLYEFEYTVLNIEVLTLHANSSKYFLRSLELIDNNDKD